VVIAPEATSINVAAWAAQQPSHAWRHVAWRNGQNRPWAALFVAVRVTPVVLWRRKQRLHDVWLLCQRPLGATTASKHDKYFLSNLPATTPLRALVRAAHLGKARRTGIRGARGLITVFLFTSPRPVTGAGGEGTAAADHAYATGGVYDIRVRIDDDDANSHSGTTRAFVTGAGLRGGTLQVVGTPARDVITIHRLDGRSIVLHAAFLCDDQFRTYDPALMQRIEIYVCGAEDQINLGPNLGGIEIIVIRCPAETLAG
jgi:hypothetical protein